MRPLGAPQDRQRLGLRGRLCRSTIQPGWTSSPSPPRPPRVLPSPGQTPRSSDSFPLAEMPSLPPAGGKGEEGGGRRRGRSAPRPAPTKSLRDAGEHRSRGEPPCGMEGAAQSESPEGKEEGSREVQTAGGGVRSGHLALEPRTSNLKPPIPDMQPGRFWFISIFWSTNSGADQQHIPGPPQAPVWEEINGPSPFVGTGLSPPPRPLPSHSPPILTHLPTLGKQRPTLLPSPTWGSTLGPSPLIRNRRIPPTSIPPTSYRPVPRSWGQPLRAPPLWEETSSASPPGDQRLGPLPLFGLLLSAAAFGEDPSPLPTFGWRAHSGPSLPPVTAPGPRCASSSSRGPWGAPRPPTPA